MELFDITYSLVTKQLQSTILTENVFQVVKVLVVFLNKIVKRQMFAWSEGVCFITQNSL